MPGTLLSPEARPFLPTGPSSSLQCLSGPLQTLYSSPGFPRRTPEPRPLRPTRKTPSRTAKECQPEPAPQTRPQPGPRQTGWCACLGPAVFPGPPPQRWPAAGTTLFQWHARPLAPPSSMTPPPRRFPMIEPATARPSRSGQAGNSELRESTPGPQEFRIATSATSILARFENLKSACAPQRKLGSGLRLAQPDSRRQQLWESSWSGSPGRLAAPAILASEPVGAGSSARYR